MKHEHWERPTLLPHRAPIRRWGDLSIGDIVEVRIRGEHRCFARVDDVSEDAQVIWLTACRSGVRVLQLRSDSVTLYPAV